MCFLHSIDLCAANELSAPSGSPVFSGQNANGRIISCACLNKVCRLLLVALSLLTVGCQGEPVANTYTVARTAPPRSPFPMDQVDHILVAVVPQGEKAWFFKLVGKRPAIDRQREVFHDFLTTVKLADSSDNTPTWELPAGWEETGGSEMRDATLVVPDEAGKLELAVSSLPLTIDWEDFLVPNVNRWLGQLQAGRLSKEKILELAKSVPTASGTATVFELAGLMPEKPMGGNPHAGLGIPPPPSSSNSASGDSTPTSPSPDKPIGNPTATPSRGLTYQTPPGWLPGRMSAMRKAAFLLPSGSPSDAVTVTSFPAGAGQMGDVQANVQRWAGQVGMQVPAGDGLAELTEPITVGGVQGTYVELESPDSSERRVSLYVAMVERQGQVWFFKMIGDRDVVSSQRQAFRDFLGSVEFQ